MVFLWTRQKECVASNNNTWPILTDASTMEARLSLANEWHSLGALGELCKPDDQANLLSVIHPGPEEAGTLHFKSASGKSAKLQKHTAMCQSDKEVDSRATGQIVKTDRSGREADSPRCQRWLPGRIKKLLCLCLLPCALDHHAASQFCSGNNNMCPFKYL